MSLGDGGLRPEPSGRGVLRRKTSFAGRQSAKRSSVARMAKRLAAVIGVLALLGIAFVTLVPAKPGGVHCGSLVKPEWTKSATKHIVNDASDLYDKAQGFDISDEFKDQATDIAANAVRSYQTCEDVRSTRHTWLYVLIGVVVIVPVAIIFVAGGARRRESAEV